MTPPTDKIGTPETPAASVRKRGSIRRFLRTRAGRGVCLALATAVATVGTWYAVVQWPHPNAYRPRRPWQLSWWLYPIEFNAEQRLPLVSAQINDIFALPDGRHVWAVGERGLILHSDNEGRTWKVQTLPAPKLEPSTEESTDAMPDEGTPVQAVPNSANETNKPPVSGSEEKAAPGDGRIPEGISPKLTIADDGGRANSNAVDLGEPPSSSNPPSPVQNNRADDPKQSKPAAQDSNLAEPARTYSISGQVTYNGKPLPGVFVHLSQTQPAPNRAEVTYFEETGIDGTYTITFAHPSSVSFAYYIRPIRAGFSFQPAEFTLESAPFLDEITAETFVATFIGVDLNSIHFVDAKTGWIVGDGGRIYATSDGGVNWIGQESTTTDDFEDVQFVDAKNGWVSTGEGIYHTETGGAKWQPLSLPEGSFVPSFDSVDPEHAFVLAYEEVGGPGILYVSNNGGVNWSKVASASGFDVIFIDFLDREHGWSLARSEGVQYEIFYTENSGKSWTLVPIAQQPDAEIFWLQALSSSAVVVVGPIVPQPASARGFLAITTTTGHSWDVVELPDPLGRGILEIVDLTNSTSAAPVSAVDGRRLWSWLHGELIFTKDGGRTWTLNKRKALNEQVLVYDSKNLMSWKRAPVAEKEPSYIRLPAPWYFFGALPLVGLLLVPVVRVPRVEEKTETSIADLFVSDRPIEGALGDVLNFRPIAQALSKFLRNENTSPPLTFAVTGPWGTGKSSLMNMVREDLEKNGFRTVWFNAWHHQKENNLLAALLENIRAQAVPPWLSRQGLGFRARLVWGRNKKWWPAWLAAGLVVALLIGHLAREPVSRAEGLLSGIDAAYALVTDAVGKVGQGKLPGWAGGGSIGAFALAIWYAIRVGWRSLRAFGVDPGSLMASLGGKTRIRDLREQLGFRYHFDKEFREVTTALRNRLAIFIDDLDRCRANNAVEVLEAVNFLVTSGNCFIILGTDVNYLEWCVDLGYNEENQGLQTDADEKLSFGRKYLQKLINIEVPVPKPTAYQIGDLIGAETEPRLRLIPQSRARRLAEGINRYQGLVSAAAAIAIVFGVGWVLPSMSRSKNGPGPGQQRQGARMQEQGSASLTLVEPIKELVGSITEQPDAGKEIVTSVGPVTEPGQISFPNLRARWAIWLGLALLVLGLWRLTIWRDPVVRDSAEFTTTLRVWSPLLFARLGTPRSMKRFVNRTRFLDMRRDAAGATEQRLRAHALVTLASLDELDPLLLSDRQKWRSLKDGALPMADVQSALLRVLEPDKAEANLGEIGAELRKLTDDDRLAFEKLRTTVRFR